MIQPEQRSVLEEEENQDKKSEKYVSAKIHTENIKNVRRNIFPTSARDKINLAKIAGYEYLFTILGLK